MFHELLSRDCKVAVAAGDSCKMRVKFKFKFVLTTVSYRAFCLFLFYKIMFNFKFKLILRKKKYMSTVFLRIFSYLWFWLVGLVGHLEKSPRPPRLARMAGGGILNLPMESWIPDIHLRRIPEWRQVIQNVGAGFTPARKGYFKKGVVGPVSIRLSDSTWARRQVSSQAAPA